MKAGTIFIIFSVVVALIVIFLNRHGILQTGPKYQPIMDSVAYGRTYQLKNLETGITVRKVHITNAKGDIIASYYEIPIVEDSLLLDHSKIP